MTDYKVYQESVPGAVEDILENNMTTFGNGVTALNAIATALNIIASEHVDIFGFDMDLSNPDPEGCVTYAGANLGYAPAYMDYANDVFEWGDWGNAFFIPKPCMLTFGGVVESYLKPDDYTKKADGTSSSVDSSTTANAMMEWPIIWCKRWQTGDVYHFRCSSREFDGANCYANLNNSGQMVKFYTPIYFGSLDGDSRLRSLSGGTNYVSTTTDAERSAAAANGSGWEIERFVDWMLINDLLVLISKTRDSQTAFGRGVNSAGAAIGQGTMNAKGLFYGRSDDASGVKVFGMENWYGNIWRRIVGWVCISGQQKIKATYGNQDGSTGIGYNTNGSGYIDLANATPSGTNGGYVNENKVTPYGLIPVRASGSASTYSCDGLWFNNGASTLALVGGGWGLGALVGASFAYLYDAPEHAYAGIGAAPSYK